MTISGPWNSTDGGDPSVDDSSLIQTAIRYGKDVAKLDLQNCKNWNHFLKIHYDRIGKDGFFSHKEIIVIFVPDLSVSFFIGYWMSLLAALPSTLCCSGVILSLTDLILYSSYRVKCKRYM
ncbi:protein SHORT ROOT IN SALT MEDIUM 1-like [Rosa chinensis]|uniref:protein SHORT ROOT IN SALT MEDIUM 1-like n=1 Tax=Rosa chinensis TaxID=74649 RepID=UPI001AD8B1FD|nr:protein SHORT ROOT IN SALT MEDIUM 1-like [Rosa chinensis]